MTKTKNVIKVADITVLATTTLGGFERRCYLMFEQQDCLGGDGFRWPLNDEYTV